MIFVCPFVFVLFCFSTEIELRALHTHLDLVPIFFSFQESVLFPS